MSEIIALAMTLVRPPEMAPFACAYTGATATVPVARVHALADERPLELGQGAGHAEQKLAVGVVAICSVSERKATFLPSAR